MMIIGSLLMVYMLCRFRLLFSVRSIADKAGVLVNVKLSLMGVPIYQFMKNFPYRTLQSGRFEKQPPDLQRLRRLVSQAKIYRLTARLSGGAEQMTGICCFFGLVTVPIYYICAVYFNIRPQLTVGLNKTERLVLSAECIFSIKIGQIIYIAGKHFFKRRLGNGKFNEWFNADYSGKYSQHD